LPPRATRLTLDEPLGQDIKMRIILLFCVLFPSFACAADWVALGEIPEAQVLLDKESLEVMGGDVKARLKYVYHKTQPAQTISQGSPFDSSINQYYLICTTQRYQVLELTVFYRDKAVGSFHADLDLNNLDKAKLGTGIMLLIAGVCPNNVPAAAPRGN